MRAEPARSTIARWRYGRLPWLTALIVITALGVHCAGVPVRDLAYEPNGQAWRLLTCHLAHYSRLHAFYDVATFALLGVIAERESRSGQALFLLLAALLVPPSVHLLHPGVTRYAGLSGLVLGQFALVLGLRLRAAHARGERAQVAALALLCAVLLAKELLELGLGHTTLIRLPYQGFVSVPGAHVASVVLGFLSALLLSAARGMHGIRVRFGARAAYVLGRILEIQEYSSGSSSGRARSRIQIEHE